MKTLTCLLIGASLAYWWLSTYGKRHITETVVVVQTNTVTQVAYRTVTLFTTQTIRQVVWVTNFVEKTILVQKMQPQTCSPPPPAPAATVPSQAAVQEQNYLAPAKPSSFRKARPAIGERTAHRNIRTHTKMDGTVVTNYY